MTAVSEMTVHGDGIFGSPRTQPVIVLKYQPVVLIMPEVVGGMLVASGRAVADEHCSGICMPEYRRDHDR
jgi:hypothetical protein